MAESALRTRSMELAKDVVLICRKMRAAGVETVLIDHLLRCVIRGLFFCIRSHSTARRKL